MTGILKDTWSDLVYAARSLSKARTFTVVCIVSLGIGIVPVIAVPYVARIPQMPPPGVNTKGLVEVITTTVESRQAADDRAGSEQVTIITKALADRLFPNAGPDAAIGKRLTFGEAKGDAPPQTLTIIGVTGDFPTSQMDADRAQLLLPLSQTSTLRPKSITTDESGIRLPDLFLIARSAAGNHPGR